MRRTRRLSSFICLSTCNKHKFFSQFSLPAPLFSKISLSFVENIFHCEIFITEQSCLLIFDEVLCQKLFLIICDKTFPRVSSPRLINFPSTAYYASCIIVSYASVSKVKAAKLASSVP